MWRVWPYLRRLWAGTGAIAAGLIVTYLYSLLTGQPVPHLSIFTDFLGDYWIWLGVLAVALATLSVITKRIFRRHATEAPRPLRMRAPTNAANRRAAIPIVGRDEELAHLRESFKQAQSGSRRIVFVTGEPGAGKTTLVTALLDSIDGNGGAMRFARGQCVEQHGTVEPYMPVFEALTRLCREPDGAHFIDILHRLAPSWLAQMPSLVSVEDRVRLQAQGTPQTRMLREMVEALEAIASDTPFVLWLEDLHWADPSTLDLIGALARRGESARLLFIGTCRPLEALPADHRLLALMDELPRQRQYAELALQPLSDEVLATHQDESSGDDSSLSPVLPASQVGLSKQRTALIGMGLMGLGIVIAGVLLWHLAPAPVATAPRVHAIRSIAVLPLDNYSGDPKEEFFADGMTDELTADLAKISALRVISRTSVMQFKGEHRKPLQEIARELNVDAVVEGSVLRSGDRVRITAELIDASADKHIWADSYERDSRDVLELQDEVASAIAREINVQLTPFEQARLAYSPKVDPVAHEAYLKGRFYLSSFTRQGVNKAIEQFRLAIKADPNFAPPYTGLADAFSYGEDWYFPPNDVMPEAKAAVRKALEINSNSAEAHTSLCFILWQYDFDWSGAERECRNAIALNPNYAEAHHQYGSLLTFQGRYQESLVEMEKAHELDPLSAGITGDVSYPSTYSGKYEIAKQQLRKALDLDPNFYLAHWLLGWVDFQADAFADSVPELEKAQVADAPPFILATLGFAYAKSGRRDQAERILADLKKTAEHQYVTPFCAALIALGLGDKDRALEGLKQTFASRGQFLVALKVDRIYDPLRSDPRFNALLREVHLDR